VQTEPGGKAEQELLAKKATENDQIQPGRTMLVSISISNIKVHLTPILIFITE